MNVGHDAAVFVPLACNIFLWLARMPIEQSFTPEAIDHRIFRCAREAMLLQRVLYSSLIFAIGRY